MSGINGGYLSELESAVFNNEPLTELLTKAIVLAGRIGSERLRAWTKKELYGYEPGEDLPPYRITAAPMYARITNDAGFNGMDQRIPATDYPANVRDQIELLRLPHSVGELEGMAARSEDARLVGGVTVWLEQQLRSQNQGRAHSRIESVFWSASPAVLQGVLSKIRAAFADLIADLRMATPDEEQLPSKAAADRAVTHITGGEGTIINFNQSLGDNSSNNIGTSPPGEPRGWWERLRHRGMILTGVGIVAGLVTIFTWLGWMPWSP